MVVDETRNDMREKKESKKERKRDAMREKNGWEKRKERNQDFINDNEDKLNVGVQSERWRLWERKEVCKTESHGWERCQWGLQC